MKPLPEDITKFESGIDVDSASDSMAKKPDTEFLREFFGRVETANFLVPYGETVTTIPLLDIKEKGKMIPIFSSFSAFEKSPLPKDRAIVMPFSKINEIVKKKRRKNYRNNNQPPRKINGFPAKRRKTHRKERKRIKAYKTAFRSGKNFRSA